MTMSVNIINDYFPASELAHIDAQIQSHAANPTTDKQTIYLSHSEHTTHFIKNTFPAYDPQTHRISHRIRMSPPHSFFDWHRDTPKKLYTLIIYHGLHGNGTIFEDFEVEWKNNCGYWFINDENSLPHCYRNDTNTWRSVSIINVILPMHLRFQRT